MRRRFVDAAGAAVIRAVVPLGRNLVCAAAFAAAMLQGVAACADSSKEGDERSSHSSGREKSSLALYDLRKPPSKRVNLPGRLREISGLATTSDGRLLAHDDERGIVYELDVDKGKVIKAFNLGRKGIKADFEGITVAEESVFLVTSDGTLFETREGADEERVDFTTHDSGVTDGCEVEGLAYEPKDRMLLLACKTTRNGHRNNAVTVFRWSVATHSLSGDPPIRISIKELRRFLPAKSFHPSGIVRDPASENYLVVAAREHAIIEITPAGEMVGAANLKEGRHNHAEGIAIGRDGTGDHALVISDEGDDHNPRLTRYRPQSAIPK